MKKAEIRVDGHYLAKINGRVVPVRVDSTNDSTVTTIDCRLQTRYYVTNLMTGRKTVFRSATKFRKELTPEQVSVLLSDEANRRARPRNEYIDPMG